MKTVLLFSSIFYLLGLKMGNTVDVLKRFIAPVKSVMHSPAPQPVRPEKSFFCKPEETVIVKKVVKKKKDKVPGSYVPLTSPESEIKQVRREELKVH